MFKICFYYTILILLVEIERQAASESIPDHCLIGHPFVPDGCTLLSGTDSNGCPVKEYTCPACKDVTCPDGKNCYPYDDHTICLAKKCEFLVRQPRGRRQNCELNVIEHPEWCPIIEVNCGEHAPPCPAMVPPPRPPNYQMGLCRPSITVTVDNCPITDGYICDDLCEQLTCTDDQECRNFATNGADCIDKSCPPLAVPAIPQHCFLKVNYQDFGCPYYDVECTAPFTGQETENTDPCEQLKCREGEECRFYNNYDVWCVDKSCPQPELPPNLSMSCYLALHASVNECPYYEAVCDHQPPSQSSFGTVVGVGAPAVVDYTDINSCDQIHCPNGQECRILELIGSTCIDKSCPSITVPFFEPNCFLTINYGIDGCPFYDAICSNDYISIDPMPLPRLKMPERRRR